MMRLIAIMVLVFGLSGPSWAAGTDAAPTKGAAVPPTEVSGKTVRAEIWNGFQNQQHLWRFKPDGAVSGSMWYVQSGWRSSNFVQKSDRGTWRADGDRLCVSWRYFFGGGTQCYSLAALRPGWLQFTNRTGGPSFSGQVSGR